MSEEGRTEIQARKNGPYIVKGNVTLRDPDGEVWDTGEKTTIALCRCGASQTKPFCDGTHSKLGFEAAERAVREAEGESES